MRVDVHAHVIVPEVLRDAAPGEAWRPRVRWEDGAQIVELGGREIRSAVRDFVAADAILAAQDEAGIDHVVLCPWVNLLGYDAPEAEALERCRIQNAGLAALQAAHPERVSVLGTVPLQDPEIAAGELEALMAVGSFAGVEIAASVNGVALGDDRLAPFWAAAEATGALVFVHPTTRGSSGPGFDDHYLWNLVGNPMETTVAAAHLVLQRRDGAPSRAARPARPRRRRGPRAPRPAAPRLGGDRAGARPADRAARGLAAPLPLRHDHARRRAACASSSRSRAPTTSCSAPTTPSTWPTRDPAATVAAAGLDAGGRAPRPGRERRAAPRTGGAAMTTVDVVVAGAGHNSLITAAYLAPGGLRGRRARRARRSRAAGRRARSCCCPATGSTRARPATR